jgi:glycosyltransferase involved in cell wall biosynthesis
MKTLFLLCDYYPFGQGELFLDNEVEVLSKNFESIYVFSMSETKGDKRQVIENVQISSFSKRSKFKNSCYAIYSLTKLALWKELITINKTFGHAPSMLHFKIILKDYIKAKQINIDLLKIIEKEKIDLSKTIFYSYWNNSLALSLAMLKTKFPNIICVSRSHGWDIDYLRHSPPYLPFKRLLLDQLNMTYTVSNQSKNLLNNLFKNKYENKISIERLGSINKRKPILNKENSKIIICSCSVLYPLKRVHLIVDIIKNLKNNSNIEWIHFGDGELKEYIIDYAKTEIPFVKMSITGMIPNIEILEFYNTNYVDLFINVSENEGIPVSIMEAQSAGIPVLATNIGGSSEIVNNENGFLVEKDFEMEEVVLIIQNYLNSSETEKHKKRLAAYGNWKNNFNAEINYSNFINNMKDLNVS